MQPDRPFAELPAALVDEVLARTQQIGSALMISFREMQTQKEERRAQLVKAKMLMREADLEYVPIPSAAGIDGAYAVERLLATDLVAAAAVAVEGLTPPSEVRYWPEPRHQVFVDTEAHDPDSGSVLRGLMIGMELSLAVQAPHDVIFLDGSLTTPLIFFNQALNRVARRHTLRVSQELLLRIKGFLGAYSTVLRAQRSDKAWVSIPKYTSRREIGSKFGWPAAQDDRALLTSLLEPGELTRPLPLQAPDEPWHLNTEAIPAETAREVKELASDITARLMEVRMIYYRPFPWLPTLRLEVSRSVSETPARLARVIHAIRHQCGAASMMEPYPLYMADRMVKSLSSAIPAFRQITSQHMAEKYEGSIDDVFLGLHSYRSESGR